MIFAVFDKNDRYKVATGLWQYDYGRVLRIQGLNLPTATEIHFSLQESGGTSITRVGTTKDGVTDVIIPDSLLENGDTTQNYKVHVFIYLTDATSGQTEYRIDLPVMARPKPEGFQKPSDTELFRQVIKEVNDSAKRSAESEKMAKRWAVGEPTVAGSDVDNAKYYSDQAKVDATKTDADKKAVEKLVKQTANIGQQVEAVKQNAMKASASEQNAKASETNAKASETNAKTSETNAKASETNASRSAQTTRTAEQNVAGLVAGFDRKVTDAGTAIDSKKNTAVKAVTDTGATEVGKVTAEGTKQLKVVQDASAGIVADRQQIQKNTQDVTTLKEDLNGLENNCADGILNTVKGENITISDSSNKTLKGLKIFGKSTQNGIPNTSTEIPILSVGQSGKVSVTIEQNSCNLVTNGLNSCEVVNVSEDYVDKSGKRLVADVIDCEKGICVQKIGKYIFDGSEHISDRYFPTMVVEMRSDGLQGQRTGASEMLLTNYGKVNFSNNDCRMFGFDSSDWNNFDKASLQNFLKEKYSSGHPVYVLYRLRKTIEEKITSAEIEAFKKLHTNYPSTVISNDEKAHMEVTYTADTKNFILNEIAKYHAQAQAQQVAMLSLMPDNVQAGMIEKDTNNILNGQGV